MVGPADYTPVAFSMPGDVLPVQHIATAYLIGSPLMTLAENPFYLMREERRRPALEFLRTLPVCWSQTVVMPQSRIGALAAFARRDGDIWYLAIAANDQTKELFSLSFLNKGDYVMSLLEEGKDGILNLREQPVNASTSLPLELPSGGGALARFTPVTNK